MSTNGLLRIESISIIHLVWVELMVLSL